MILRKTVPDYLYDVPGTRIALDTLLRDGPEWVHIASEVRDALDERAAKFYFNKRTVLNGNVRGLPVCVVVVLPVCQCTVT